MSGSVLVDASMCFPQRLSSNVSRIALLNSSLVPIPPQRPTGIPNAPVQQTSVQFPPRMDWRATVLSDPPFQIANLTFLNPVFNIRSIGKRAPVDIQQGNFSTVLVNSLVTWTQGNGSYQPLKRPATGLFEVDVPAEFGGFSSVSGVLRVQDRGSTLGLFMNNSFRLPLRTVLFPLNLTGTGIARLVGQSYLNMRLVVNATGPNPCFIGRI